jgi:hypothetical protein
VDEAKENIFRRYTANSTKWIRLYAEQWQQWVVAAGKMPAGEAINFWDPRLYDLAIDTYSSNKQETLQRVLDTLKNG